MFFPCFNKICCIFFQILHESHLQKPIPWLKKKSFLPAFLSILRVIFDFLIFTQKKMVMFKGTERLLLVNKVKNFILRLLFDSYSVPCFSFRFCVELQQLGLRFIEFFKSLLKRSIVNGLMSISKIIKQ